MQFSHNSAPKHHLKLQNVSIVACCLKELCAFGNWGIQLKEHSCLQCVKAFRENGFKDLFNFKLGTG
jgi:hypothetical protein